MTRGQSTIVLIITTRQINQQIYDYEFLKNQRSNNFEFVTKYLSCPEIMAILNCRWVLYNRLKKPYRIPQLVAK